MRRFFFSFMIFLLFSHSALAADGGETTVMTDGTVIDNTTGQPTGEGGQCNWDDFKQSLKDTESCGGTPTVVNCYGYAGLYQFGEGALAQIGWYQENGSPRVDGDNKFEGSWSGKAPALGTATPTQRRAKCGQKGCGQGSGELVSPTLQAFLNNEAAQEQAFVLWMDYLNKATSKCHSYIGTTINSPSQGSCTVTRSGILAGGHLCGAAGVCLALRGEGNNKDANDTSCFDYICKHGGFSTPYDNGQTAQQACGQSVPGNSPGPGSLSEADPEEQKNTETFHYTNLSDTIDRVWIGGMMLMTRQLTASMMKQVEMIGTLFDAKNQLETKRLMQQKTAQAHKDYHPSEQMCAIGTMARNLANTDRRANLTEAALAQRGLQRETMAGDAVGTEGRLSDQFSRFKLFTEKFCNPKDNADGFKDLCQGSDKKLMNADIDFTRTIDTPLTLQFDALDGEVSEDEIAVYALMDNLFQNKLPKSIPQEITTLDSFVAPYQDLRSLNAMRSVARNSMANIVSQKGFGPPTDEDGSNAPFLRAFIKEMGITDEEEITRMIGERPSYWAQMEILTKKIYQHPNFTANLYDKPANVTRIRAAMRAIKTMQDRDIYEALLRREMLISVLTELSIRQQQERMTNAVRRLDTQN